MTGTPHISLSGPAARTAPAFTLVELLAVLAVISLLTAVMLPALRVAGQRASRAGCQGRLRSLVGSMRLYAGEYAGGLPTGPVARAAWGDDDPDRGGIGELYDATRSTDPTRRSTEGWFGLGLVWKTSFLDAGGPFYCPDAAGAGGVAMAQAWPRRFDPRRNPADGKTRIYANYAYRGGRAGDLGLPTGPVSLTTHPGQTPILCDNPCNGAMWHDGGYNNAFLDGSVRFRRFRTPPVSGGDLPAYWAALTAAKTTAP